MLFTAFYMPSVMTTIRIENAPLCRRKRNQYLRQQGSVYRAMFKVRSLNSVRTDSFDLIFTLHYETSESPRALNFA